MLGNFFPSDPLSGRYKAISKSANYLVRQVNRGRGSCSPLFEEKQ